MNTNQRTVHLIYGPIAAGKINLCPKAGHRSQRRSVRAVAQDATDLVLEVAEKDEALLAKVVDLIERPDEAAQLPLDVRGTEFQMTVWDALQTVPPGSTVTYASLAEQIGAPHEESAVAKACALNPLAVAIPCHRAVRDEGELAGYRWGVERKRAPLEREAGVA